MKSGRRLVVAGGIGLLLAPRAALPQAAQRTFRLGVLARGSSSARGGGAYLFVEALQKLGYKLGRNLVVEYRFAEGQEDRLPSLAADLIAKNVDVIVADGNPAILAAKRATAVIPIVMLFSFVPVELGLVASLARPGANITGTTMYGPETTGKTLQVLRDMVPGLRRVVTLIEKNFPGYEHSSAHADRAFLAMGIQSSVMPVHNVEELDTAFARITRDRPDALWIVLSGVINTQRARIIEFAARQRLPAMYTVKLPVTEGGLISYTFNMEDLLGRAADITDRILKGTPAKDIPIEQPTRFDLAINRKTAKALGITIPLSVLLQATEVID